MVVVFESFLSYRKFRRTLSESARVKEKAQRARRGLVVFVNVRRTKVLRLPFLAARAVLRDGSLVQDFLFENAPDHFMSATPLRQPRLQRFLLDGIWLKRW